MTTPSPDPVTAAKRLAGSLDAMTAELRKLRAYGRTNRHLIVATAVSLLLDLGLTLVLIFTYSAARSAGQVATAEHANLIAACEAGNQTRAEQVLLWTHLAQISTPPPHATKAQKAKDAQEIAALLRYIRRVFAPRPCQQVYATSSPGR